MKLDLKYRLLYAFLKLHALLPFWMLYFMSDVLYLLVYKGIGYRTRVVRVNLELVFGDMSEKERRAIERKFYRHFCDLIVETIKLLHISDKTMRKRFSVTGADLVDELSEGGTPVVVFLGHFCNWEWVQAMSLYFGTEDKVVGQVYKPLRNKLMDRITLKIRSRFSLESIPDKRVVRRLIETRKEGKNFIIGFISDQRSTGKTQNHWTKFLGIDTPFIVGGERVGEMSGANYLYLDVSKVKRGRYSGEFRRLEIDENDSQENPYTREFLKNMEATIRRQPAYWLWTHKRWVRSSDGGDTNYYAKK